MARQNTYTEYVLELKKETVGAFIFIIPETGNEVMLPKSQCEVFVRSEDEPLLAGETYTVSVSDWIAEQKKMDEGGEAPEIVKVKVKLIDERDSAIRVQYREDKMWFPKSTIETDVFPGIDEEFTLEVKKWLFEKKIEEARTPATGRRVVGGGPRTESSSQTPKDDFVEDDIPF